MSRTVQRTRRRLNLWRANPHCHWCNTLTVLPTGASVKGQTRPDNTATLDHVRSRLHEERVPGRPWPEGSNTVLACHKCNAQRNVEEQAGLPVEELRRRSQRGHFDPSCLTSYANLASLLASHDSHCHSHPS